MFVYRDPDLAAGAQEEDAAYWYDLPADTRERAAPAVSETRGRGPFEPLVSSSGPPPDQAPSPAAGPEGTGTAEPEEPGASGDGGREDPASARARKLEQIRDFYLTAEAIGEDNVGKHFDELLAQQRALIKDYFKQSPGDNPEAGDQTSGSPQGVAAEQPGA